MKRMMVLAAAVAAGVMYAPTAGAVELVGAGRSDYVIAGNTNDPAVVDLQKYVERMTAVRLPLVDALSNAIPEKAIVVTSDAKKLPFKPGEISTQGYRIRVVGPKVFIYSPGDSPDALKPQKQRKGRPRGLQFGVYGLLDEFFGCRFLTPAAEIVPAHDRLALPDGLDAVREPAYPNRIFTSDQRNSSKDVFWLAKNGVGHEFYGFTGHSLYNYLPPDKHFKAHPEWYPENNGVRSAGTAWFCWTNKEMLKALIEACRAELRKGKTAPERAFPLGQGDGPAKCTCVECEKIRKEYGADSAAYLLACNEIAKALEGEFPNRKISVSAYFNTQLPPVKEFELHRNITVDYTRTGDHMKSLYHPKHAEFAKDLRRWDGLVGEISVWDWCVDFGTTLMPFPDIKARAEDIRFMRTFRNVRTYAPQVMAGGDFIELREWVFARMMWDVSRDIEALEREFMTGYYGPEAGAVLTDYLMRFQKYAEEDPGSYNAIFGGYPSSLSKTLYTPARKAEAEGLFRRAMGAAERSSDTNLVERVKLAYLRGFAAIRLTDAGKLEFCEKDGRRFLLPGGDVTLTDALLGVGDLIYRNLAKMDEFGDNLFQSAKFHAWFGAELDSRVENDRIALDSASALSGGILRLVDKKSGLDVLAVDRPTSGGKPGLQHYVGCRSAVNRKGKVTAVKGGQELRTYGNVSSGIWWTPDVLPIERVFTLADGERGFSFRSSFTETKSLQWWKDTMKVDKPFYSPLAQVLLCSSAPDKSQVCVTDGKSVRRSTVQPGMPFVIDLATNAARTVWIVDADPKRPAVRLDVPDPLWGRMSISAEGNISALRVTLTAKEKLTVRASTNRIACGSFDLHLADRGELPPALLRSGAVSAKSADELRLGKRTTVAIGSDEGGVATFDEAFELLPRTAWSNDITFVVHGGALAYCGGKFPAEAVKAMNGHRLVIRGNTVVDAGVRLDRNPRAVFTHNRFLGGRTTIQLVYAKGKAADGMVFTDNVFDRTTNLMVREGEVWDLQKVNAYFATEGNRAVAQQR